jgi:hypothetical protein
MDNSLTVGAGNGSRFAPLRAVWHTIERMRERRALKAARWAADTELSLRSNPPLRLAWRVEELVATKHRLDLAHSLRSLVRDASPRYLAAASPVNRVAVRAETDALLALADRLSDLERPVSARGVVVIERLLVDSSGPLYDRERVDELPPYLDSALAALEPEPH